MPLDEVAFHGLIDYKEVPFSLVSYYNGIAHFQHLGDQKIQQGFKNGKIFTLLSLTDVSFHFRMTLLKGLLKEIHTQKVVGIAKITYLPKSD